MATAGTETTIVQPWVYYAPRLTPIPGPKHGFRSALAAPWVRLQNFDDENAVVVDFNNPKIRVRTQDNGIISTNPSSDDAITIAVATQTPSGDILTKALSLVEYMSAAVASAVAEVETLTITAGATTNGSVRITLDGDQWDVTVTTSTEGTTAGLATRLRTAANYTPVGTAGPITAKWAISGATNDVIYTAVVAGQKVGTFSLASQGTSTGAAGSFVRTTAGVTSRPKVTSWWFDPNAEKNFMLLIEGIALAGGIFDTDTKVYFVAYNVEPGEQAGGRGGGGGGGGGGGRGGGGGGRRGAAQPGQITMNYKGENAHLQVALQLDCQPEPGIASVFPTNISQVSSEAAWPSGGIDPFKRANFWNVDSIA